MTENEAVEILKNNFPKTCKMVDGRYKGGFDDTECEFGQALLLSISALEEIQQYRAIGIVERFQQLSEQFKPHMIDETSCPERNCNKCDRYRKENEKYHEIGTVEECRQARERQIAKKVNNRTLLRDLNGDPYSVRGDCPNCGNIGLLSNTNYCNACGQKLDWSE